MTLENSVAIWEIKHPNDSYFDAMTLNAAISRDNLFNWLMYEYGEMEVIDGDSGAFHDRMKYFFEIHDWNISKLVESTALTYDPIKDYGWKQDRRLDRDVATTDNKTTTGTKNGTASGEWEEERKSNGQDVNLVSAFNDLPATINSLKDTEHDRVVSETKQIADGTNSETTNETTSGKEDATGAVDEDVTEHIERTGTQGHSYQELIEEERKQAEFNIYKWIGRHFCKELLIAVW